MRMKVITCLLLALFASTFAAPAAKAPAAKASAGKAAPAPSEIKPLPPAVADSLNWFAAREMGGANMPFTRAHLAKVAAGANRVALVYFATWCVPCRAGIKALVNSRQELEQNGIKIILVNAGEREEAKIKKMVEGLGANVFPVVLDPYKRLSEGIGLVKEGENIALPMTLVVDNAAKPVFMIGQEGSDWPSVLWTK